MNARLLDAVRRAHTARFGAPPEVVAYAPGRVEILGNHTDYNAGLVLSAALDAGIAFAVSPAHDNAGAVQALDVCGEAAFRLPVTGPVSGPAWLNLVLGVARGLAARGRLDRGFQATFSGDLPAGAGLSSSAALEVSAALALARLFRLELPPLDLARICQAAEHAFTGARCGLLDQLSSLYGRAGALVFTDFQSLAVATLPLADAVRLLLADTRVQHRLVESEYNARRAQCEQAVAFFATVLSHPVGALRDVSAAEWAAHAAGLDPVAARRARHVIEENARVEAAAALLKTGNLAEFGRLMFASHESSRTLFENSCPELDGLVAWARARPDVLGARLTGGGFGGSVVLLLRPGSEADRLGADLADAYLRAHGRPCVLRVARAADGARVL